MEFLTDHLLELRLTGPGPMNTTIDQQHDNFARQLSAFEKLLIITYSKLSLEELHKNLKLVLKAGNKGMLKITSINALIECVELYKVTASSAKEAEDVASFFEQFLKDVAHLAQVKKFFHETIYHCLYEFFYDPHQDDSCDEGQDGLSDEDDDDKSDIEKENNSQQTNAINIEDLPDDIELDLNIAAQPTKKRKKKRKSKQKLLKGVKRKKRIDNRMKVLEQIQRDKALRKLMLANQKLEEPQNGEEFERLKVKTESQKLAFATKRIFAIQSCWNELITQGTISTKNFEKDSARLIKDYKNYLPFEPVFRLLPDMLVKGFKIVELSKIWYNSSRRLGGAEIMHYRTATDFLEVIRVHEKSIESLTNRMKYKRESRAAKQTERKMLVNQILRFDDVKEKYDHCVEREKELKEYYKQLKAERNAEYPKLDQLSRNDPQYKECYEQIQYLAESMKGVYRELQTASYELELVKQDYNVEMGTRANLIRLQDDVKFSIQDIDISLPIDEKNREDSLQTSQRLKANIGRMWMALYQSEADDDLLKQADNVLKQHKYSTKMPINSQVNEADDDSVQSASSDDEVELERNLENALTTEMERAASSQSTESATSLDSPPPPLPPQTDEQKPELLANKRQSTFTSEFHPSTAGILDQHEAREYRQRVERLKKKFELDLSGLKTTVDCHVDEHEKNVVESGDEADMESEPEEAKPVRPQSKKLKKRNSDSRYSPLSAASDEYIYRQHKPQAKTVYILKKSKPREPPENRYILKMVPGAKLLPQKTIYKQQKPSDFVHRPKPLERKWGTDYETLQALDNNFIESLSVHTTPRTKKPTRNSLMPILPLEHQEGVFTPNLELSDGDISIDSGTGNSLDSDDEANKEKKEKVKNRSTGYKHKPRVTLTETQHSPKPVKPFVSKLPILHNRLRPKKSSQQISSPSKSSPESLESRPIVTKPKLAKPVVRNTLHSKKPVKPVQIKQRAPKPPVETHPLAPTHKVTMNKGLQRKLPLGKLPKSFQQPSIAPRKQVPAPIIDVLSDDEDEIFKQTVNRPTLPPKPSVRVSLAPTKSKRRYGIHHSLGRVN